MRNKAVLKILAISIALAIVVSSVTPCIAVDDNLTDTAYDTSPSENITADNAPFDKNLAPPHKILATKSIAPEEEWNKTFGGSDGDKGYSVQQTSDGGYIVAGATRSFGVGWRDVYLVKTAENGDEEWNKTFGGMDDDAGCSIQQTSDGGYIIAGNTYSFGADSVDVWLIKVKGEAEEEYITIG